MYRARDDRLHRDVALKIVSPRFALDPARLARFEREAQILAALNHPNVATLSGWKKSAASRRWSRALEGETLADQVPRNPRAFPSRRRWTSRSKRRPGSRPRRERHRAPRSEACQCRGCTQMAPSSCSTSVWPEPSSPVRQRPRRPDDRHGGDRVSAR